jgi:hypothetical protein
LLLDLRNHYHPILDEDESVPYEQRQARGLGVVEQIDEILIIICVVDFEVRHGLSQIATHMRALLTKHRIQPSSIRKVLAKYCKEKL